MLKKLATVISAAALVVGVPTAAHADPKKADVITLHCENGQSYEIRVFSNGTWSPGLLTTGNGVVRPVAVSISGTFTPADGSDPETFSESAVKNVGAKTQTTDCTFAETGSDESGTFTLEGTVTIVVPRH
jgi:hypothetical protein